MPEVPANAQTVFSREQYRTLLEVAEVIAAHRDLGMLFDDLARRLPRIVPFDYINLVLHDSTRGIMRLHLLVAPKTSTISPGLEFPIDESPGGLVWKTQQPLAVENVALESRFPKLTPLLLENGVQSFCAVPLTTALRRLGAMGFGSMQRRVYQEAEVAFMQQVAKQVAVAVDNVLHDETAQAAQRQLTRERDRVRLLLEVNNAVVSHLNLDDLFPAVSVCLRKVVQHDGSALVLVDLETRRFRVHVLSFAKNESFIEEGQVESDGACRKSPSAIAITTRKPVLFTHHDLVDLCGASRIAQRLVDEGIRAFCSVPLLSHDRALGALNVGRRRDDMFSPEDIELLCEVAKQIAIAVENAQAYREISELKDRLAKENLYLEEEVRTDHNFGEIVGDSAALRRVLKEVETVAPTGSTVLIRGETGTGKELVARALHDLSPRRDRTFVKLNCAAIPTGLLESELFGHEKGAFTGAIMQKVGRFELAHQGTLFLDEVGDIPLELQPKLLRALQEQEFERLGSTRTVRVDVRLVAATNRDLAKMVADGQFRSDLYYRLNVFPVVLPPLRDRREDIPMLARHFTQRFARRMGRQIETIPTAVMEALLGYVWPGNIREMQNVIERAVILSPGTSLFIDAVELSVGGQEAGVSGQKSVVGSQESGARNGELSPDARPQNSGVTLADAERDHILGVLRETGWVLGGPNGAAARLAMKRTTLQSKMKKLGISRPV
ncbi:MAG: sigma 54-interacting transcriptional regulator [Gemmataceae bacterium]|nr:sigma 54-interacting transcriptional regulator [Gemmataceae bacterium]MCI0738975.1 sigma 54-interacting transcriptional regulator [Gemmataceae bacterium]